MNHGRYEIVERLGEGESAVVFRTRDLAQGGREVALKLLKRQEERDAARFRREFQVLSELRHPNLISVLDFGVTADDELYYTSEYHVGQRTLCEAVRPESETPLATKLELIVSILRVLEYVHTRGVVHRDLKPGNVLIDREGVVRLSDFGLVGVAEGQVAGTPHYMAPEVLRRLRVDRRCDLYSLGVILYELVCGELPYDGTAAEVARKHLEDRPRPPREVAPGAGVSEPLERIMLKLLAKEPSHRFPSANAVIAALSEATGKKHDFETSETKQAYVLSGKFVGRDREVDWLTEGFQRATGPLSWERDPRQFDRRARFQTSRAASESERRRGGDRRARSPRTPSTPVENPPALMVFLRGGSGVGKTRLLDELRRRCQLDGAVFLRGRCRKHQARGYEPFLSVFQEAAQLEGADQESRWAVSHLLAQVEQSAEPAQGVERLRLVDALAEFLIAQSTRRPLVLALEDLQWARGETLDLLRHVYRTLVAILAGADTQEDRPRMFVVGTYRAEEIHGPDLGQALRELRHDRFFEELTLQPLKADDTGELIRSMLGVPNVPRSFVDRVMTETRGNPLFVELLMEELVERGVVDRTRGLWRLDPDRLAEVEVPSRVHELVLSRLARLPQRSLIEWLAVLDRDASPDLLARIAERTVEEVRGDLEELIAQRLVERQPGTNRHLLAHSRVRDVVYEATSERSERHAQVARVLEEAYALGEGVTANELAHHLLEAGAGLEAIRWARQAAESAAALRASERACELYGRALRVADDHLALVADDPKQTRLLCDEKLAVLRALVHELSLLERFAEARTHTLEGLRVAQTIDDPQAEVSALAHLGTLNARLKESDDAKRYFFEALKKAERIEYGKGIGTSLLGLGEATLEEGRLEEARDYLERSLRFEEDLGDRRGISSCLRALANAHQQQGRLDGAIEHARQALEQDEQTGDAASQIASLEQLADLHFLAGDYELAIEVTEQAIALAKLADDKPAIARCLLALGSAHERLGQRAEARRRFGDALALTRRLGLGAELAQVLNSVGWMHHQAGDYEEALTAFNEATTLWNTNGDKEGYGLGLTHLGLCYGWTGELERSASCYDAAIRVSWEIASRPAELEASWGRALTHEAAGERSRARELLDKTVLKAREQKLSRIEALVLADLARLLAADGEGSRGLRAARRARALALELRDEAVTTRVTLRAAEVDSLRGALGPAVDAFRLRSAWMRGAQDHVLAMEAELAYGRALTRLGDYEGAGAALEATLNEARARGVRILEARTRIAQGELALEQALLRGSYRPGRIVVAPAELGQARASFEAARAMAEETGAQALTCQARLGLIRITLLEGTPEEAADAIRAVLDDDGAGCDEVRTEGTILLAEVALTGDPEQVLVRADEVESPSPFVRLQVGLLKGVASGQAGLRLEARASLQEGGAALDEIVRSLEAPDRVLLERTPLPAALQAALSKAREEATARSAEVVEATSGARVDRQRVMGFLRASREVGQQSTAEAQLRILLDRAIALFGAERGLLVKIDADDEQTVKKARLAAGRDLPREEVRTSTSIVGQVARTGEVLILPDAGADLEVGERPSVVDLELRSMIAIPLRLQGRTVYIMILEDRETAGRFKEEDRELAETLCEQGAFALERTRLREESERQSSELESRAREIERLKASLEASLAEQSQELDAVKAALKGREYELGVQSSYANIIGRSAPMHRVFMLLDKVTQSDVPILVQGESGTGKELVARAVHFNGPRKDKPFLSINVAALPETLLESELFGHVRGAFTGADRDKVGLFEAAHTGTLFLDEVGDMPAAMQSKLLRVLQENEVRAIGGRKPRKIDVRIVSASNQDLPKLVAEGRFRADLFYRLNVVSVSMPPLRERKEDIPPLVDHFLDKIAEQSGQKRKSLDRKVIDHLMEHDWPGNVRELENELRRLVALSGLRITERDLSPHLRTSRGSERLELGVPADPSMTLKERIAVIERRFLIEALRQYENNKTRTAKALGLSRYGFLKKLDKYELRGGNL